MSDDFQVGDVVVRIKPCHPRPRSAVNRQRFPEPPHGAVLRVAGVYAGFGWTSLYFVAFPTEHYTRGWDSRSFRKLPRADEQFTEQMRACKPQRVGEPA